MNALSTFCFTYDTDPLKVMNLLQEWNIVSDNCCTVEDVAPCDLDLAIRFCKLNRDDIRNDKGV